MDGNEETARQKTVNVLVIIVTVLAILCVGLLIQVNTTHNTIGAIQSRLRVIEKKELPGVDTRMNRFSERVFKVEMAHKALLRKYELVCQLIDTWLPVIDKYEQSMARGR